MENSGRMPDYHRPVLLEASVRGLAIRPDGTYVDATFGGGGHTRKILEQLGDNGRLIAFDQDEDARRNLPQDDRLTFVQHNFRYLKRFLRLYGSTHVAGILADLGVSSYQFDSAGRGFSFRFDGALDMRMNQAADRPTAAQVLQQYDADRLQQLFSRYGEVRNARTLAQQVVRARSVGAFATIGGFIAFLEPYIRGQRTRYLAQVFQALRMEVNDEVGALDDMLRQSLEVLEPGGRLVVIAYHSVEDRMVKHFLKTGNTAGKVEKDFYGKIYRPFRLITRKAMTPTEAEIVENPRARSAKLRIGEKL